MGRRGPKPKPQAVKQQKKAVRSTRSKRVAAAASTPTSSEGSSGAPSWLKGEALKVWQRLAPQLRQAKLLADVDAMAFARYCTHFARWLDLQNRLKKNGDIYEIETASGKVRRADPAFLMADRLDRMLLAFEDRFGLNPSERQRIFVARAQGGVGDLFGNQTSGGSNPRADDPAADATPAAKPTDTPVGLLN